MSKFNAVCVKPTQSLTKGKKYSVKEDAVYFPLSNKKAKRYLVTNDRGYNVHVMTSRFKLL